MAQNKLQPKFIVAGFNSAVKRNGACSRNVVAEQIRRKIGGHGYYRAETFRSGRSTNPS